MYRRNMPKVSKLFTDLDYYENRPKTGTSAPAGGICPPCDPVQKPFYMPKPGQPTEMASLGQIVNDLQLQLSMLSLKYRIEVQRGNRYKERLEELIDRIYDSNDALVRRAGRMERGLSPSKGRRRSGRSRTSSRSFSDYSNSYKSWSVSPDGRAEKSCLDLKHVAKATQKEDKKRPVNEPCDEGGDMSGPESERAFMGGLPASQTGMSTPE